MRTTVTLDPDVAAKLKQVAYERGISFKEALNASVRSGLSGEVEASRPYEVVPRRLEARPGVDLRHAMRLAGSLEDAELQRELEQRR